jgi:hypothetical protein
VAGDGFVKVLVIPEDPTLDQYILKPIVHRLFADLGRTARIDILSNPRLRGVDQALNQTVLTGIAETFRMIDLFLVLVDRDGDPVRPALARTREGEHAEKLFVCLAVEEVEVWMLALHRDSLRASWNEIRAEMNPKERFALPFLRDRAPKLDAGGGRAWAMRELGAGWRGLLQVCPELQELRERLRGWLESRI